MDYDMMLIEWSTIRKTHKEHCTYTHMDGLQLFDKVYLLYLMMKANIIYTTV